MKKVVTTKVIDDLFRWCFFEKLCFIFDFSFESFLINFWFWVDKGSFLNNSNELKYTFIVLKT